MRGAGAEGSPLAQAVHARVWGGAQVDKTVWDEPQVGL